MLSKKEIIELLARLRAEEDFSSKEEDIEENYRHYFSSAEHILKRLEQAGVLMLVREGENTLFNFLKKYSGKGIRMVAHINMDNQAVVYAHVLNEDSDTVDFIINENGVLCQKR